MQRLQVRGDFTGSGERGAPREVAAGERLRVPQPHDVARHGAAKADASSNATMSAAKPDQTSRRARDHTRSRWCVDETSRHARAGAHGDVHALVAHDLLSRRRDAHLPGIAAMTSGRFDVILERGERSAIELGIPEHHARASISVMRWPAGARRCASALDPPGIAAQRSDDLHFMHEPAFCVSSDLEREAQHRSARPRATRGTPMTAAVPSRHRRATVTRSGRQLAL